MTPAQQALIKADILANADMNTLPANTDGSYEIARLYNLPTTQDVWQSEVPTAAIYDAINWAQYTPTWTPNATDTQALAALYTNSLLTIQTKQMNLQAITQGREFVNASKANVRTGLRDAVVAVPAGAVSGNVVGNVSPGGASGVTVLTACVRKANRIEKLLSTAAPTLGGITANVMSFEGNVSYQDIEAARNS